METSPTYAAPKVTQEEFADRVLRFFDRPAKDIEFSHSGHQAYYAECKGLQISFIWGNGWTVALPALNHSYKCHPTLSAAVGALVTNLQEAGRRAKQYESVAEIDWKSTEGS